MQNCLVKFLNNGIKVIVCQDVNAIRTACAVKINAGSFHEPIQWPGLAHYLEHCLFLGSLGESTSFAQKIQSLGGRYNAKTLSSKTLYFADLPAEKAELLLAALAILISRPAFDENKTHAELNILDAEYQARCSDEQQQRLNAFFEQLNNKHYLSRFYAGCIATLGHNFPELQIALKNWHAAYYVAQRISVCVTGPQTPEILLDAVERHFSSIPAGAPEKPLLSAPLFTELKTHRLLVLAQEKAVLTLLWPLTVPEKSGTELFLNVLNYLLEQSGTDDISERLNGFLPVHEAEFSWIEASKNQGFLQLTITLCRHEKTVPFAQVAALCTDWLYNLSHNKTRWPDADTERALFENAEWLDAQLPDFERVSIRLLKSEVENSLSAADFFPCLAEIIQKPLFMLGTRPELIGEVKGTRWFPVRHQVRPLLLDRVEIKWPPYKVDTFWQRPAHPFIENEVAVISGLRAHLSTSFIYWPNLAAGQAEHLETELANYWQQHFNKGRIWGAEYMAFSRPSLLRFVVIAPHAVLPDIMAALWQKLASSMANYSANYAAFVAPPSPWLLRRMLHEPLARWITWPVAQYEEQHPANATEAGQHAVLLRIFAPFQNARLEAVWRVLGALWAHPFYQRLRVEQGLGYALFCRFERGEDAFELQFALQSPHASAPVLQAAIRGFIQDAVHELAHITPAALADLQTAAALGLQDSGQGLAQFKCYCLTQWAAWPRGWDEDVLFNLQTLNLDTLRQQARTLLASETSSVYWRWLVSDGSPR